MHVVATAGHVDHGKSTLIRRLTGIDPDRLEEERRRGLTIDLGFAWLSLPGGNEIGIVDVPGHERFIRNMLAGVGAIDIVLFVVAATEGWKPQSQEHLDIIDLLDIRSGLVALTKIDEVDEHRRGVVSDEIATRLTGTSLEGATVIPVSGVTGEGIEQLIFELERIVGDAEPIENIDQPRLWIDRVFTMKGAGTVVTGTLVDGTLELDAEVEVVPSGHRARIRSIQSHRKRVETIGPGNRVALNLVGSQIDSIERGDVIGYPGGVDATDTLLVEVRALSHIVHTLTERGAYRFHCGSFETGAQVRFVDGALEPGAKSWALLRLSSPAAVRVFDRFVLRESGRRETSAGGRVVETVIPEAIRSGPQLSVAASRRADMSTRSDHLRILLDESIDLGIADVLRRTGMTQAAARAADGVWLATRVFSASRFEDHRKILVGVVHQHQVEHPREPGIPVAKLRTSVDIPDGSVDEIVDRLIADGHLTSDAGYLRTPDHQPNLGGPEREALAQEMEAMGSTPPTLPELKAKHGRELMDALLRSGELVKISDEIVFTVEVVEKIKTLVRDLASSGDGFTVADFRDTITTTRKYAVPLVEYLDSIGFTKRQGDYRTLGPGA